MSPEEFTEKMLAINETHGCDIEESHCMADDLMCDLLKELGYDGGVFVFDTMDKWYA